MNTDPTRKRFGCHRVVRLLCFLLYYMYIYASFEIFVLMSLLILYIVPAAFMVED